MTKQQNYNNFWFIFIFWSASNNFRSYYYIILCSLIKMKFKKFKADSKYFKNTLIEY